MNDPGHLNRAPIREAVLDVFVDGVEVAARDLQAFGERVRADFPKERATHFVSGGFAVNGAEATTSARVSELGYQYRSEDELDILQARTDGFSTNRLTPYLSGDHLFQLARHWWPAYVDVARPRAVRGVALRYINEFEVPCPDGVFDRDTVASYLPLIPPPVSVDLVSGIEGFVERTAYRTVNGDRAVITTMSNQPKDGVIPFVLDIEVAHQAQWHVDSDEPWQTLGRLRQVKNQLFAASTSPKLRKEFR